MKLTFNFEHETINELRAKMAKYDHIVVYTDGASRGNPGSAGSGAAFFGEDSKGSLDFICGARISLGHHSNNFAEYTAVIMAQLILAYLEKRVITINTDSKILVRQVKGIYAVKNVRLVYTVPIVHDLILHFNYVALNYVPREQNQTADILAKRASYQMDGDDSNPDGFQIKFKP